jgi:[ribosomal protein S18]-alanine N-acetyltransferase
MEIVRLGPGDGARLAAAVRALHSEAASAAWLAAFLAQPTHHAVAAFDGEEPVGLAYGYELARVKRDRVALMLYEIDVAPSHRRRGIGRALIEAFRPICAERDADGMWLLTDDGNPGAVRLYTACGGERHPVDQVMFSYPEGWGRPA